EIERRFARQRWQVHIAGDLAAGRRLLATERIEPLVVIADLNLPDGSALDLLAELTADQVPLGEWIFLTAFGTIPDSVRALQLGAYDFLEKPYEESRLDLAVASAARCARAQRMLRDRAAEGSHRYGPESFIGSSPQARETRQLLAQIAAADFSALIIQGETGTGKGLAARILHYSGPRVSGPLVEVNCAALPEDLLESELFGHEAGAFTGAKGRHRGLFEQADGGTLFLDEIGELPLGLQAKLLTAVEEKRIRRVGGERDLEVDVRIIAATNRDLAGEVAAGRFRGDLYHRLSVFKVRLPTLAERPEDIPELAWLLIAEFNQRAHSRISRVPELVWAALRSHAWPGNVRELRNVIERCVLLSGGDTLDQRWLQLAPAPAPCAENGHGDNRLCFELDGSLTLERIEARCLQEALWRRRGNVTQAARLLGMTRQSMRYRLEKHGLKAHLQEDDAVT
ncbi:MAG: sigma-54 dependent transcriptional regulator, partial [Chromatiaceae bacterium]